MIDQAESRYYRISYAAKGVERLLVELFLKSDRKLPQWIVLDLDVTDDPVHGNQEQTFFNTYYGSVCYAPLYLFCVHHLLAAKLRPDDVEPADGELEKLQRVIEVIREQWKQTKILVRGEACLLS